MNFFANEIYLKKILKDRLNDANLSNISFITYELQSRFGFDLSDIDYIFYKCPTLLEKNGVSEINNINELTNSLNLKGVELKYLILKMPILLLINADLFKYRLNLISTTFGCSMKDAIKLLYLYPELSFLTKKQIVEKVKQLSQVLNEYGLKIRLLLKMEPRLIFANKADIENIKKYLMKNFTLSESESLKVLCLSPSLIVEGVESVINKFNTYYPKYFIKRDLKEILNICPEFLSLNEYKVIEKINYLKNVFSLSTKESCNFIRLEPNVLFFNSIVDRIKSFAKYNINFKYVFCSPKICTVPEISIPVKFLIARILSLENEFNKICLMDSNLFISRFLFMQTYGYFEHKDLLENEEYFYNKYNISTQVLKANHKLDYDSLTKLCLYYVNSKDKMKHWTDMVFPKWEDILEYLHSGFDKHLRINENYYLLKENYLFSRRQFDLYLELKTMLMFHEEIVFVLRKNFNLNKFLAIDVKNIVLMLKKYGFSQEQIIKFLMKKTHLFNYSIRDFNILINEICETEKCDEITAIEKFM